MDYLEERWERDGPPDTGRPWYVRALVLYLSLVIPGQLLLFLVLPEPSDVPPWWVLVLSFASIHGLALVVVGGVVHRRSPRGQFWHTLLMHRLDRQDLLVILGLASVLVPFMTGWIFLAMRVFERMEWPIAKDVVLQIAGQGGLGTRILLIVVAVVLAPVAEELLFRHVLHQSLQHYFGRLSATLLASFFFALIHGSLFALAVLFVLGLILQEVKNRTRNLWYPILMHAAYNAFVMTLVLREAAQQVPAGS